MSPRQPSPVPVSRGFFALAALLLAACSTLPPPIEAEALVRLVDEQQRALVAAGDAAGLDRLAHASLRINAPGGRVLTRAQFLANMRNGAIAAEQFERTAEDVAIAGRTATVMGREVFTPAATSELGRSFGSRPLDRRYTNIYVWEDGRWLWLSRHANIVPPTAR